MLQLFLNTHKKSLTRRICRIPKTWLCSSFRMQKEKSWSTEEAEGWWGVWHVREANSHSRNLVQGWDHWSKGKILWGKKMHNYTDLSRSWRDNFLVPLREVVQKEKRKSSWMPNKSRTGYLGKKKAWVILKHCKCFERSNTDFFTSNCMKLVPSKIQVSEKM